MSRSAVALLAFLAVIAWFAFRPANPSRSPSRTPSRVAWQWLRVLGCRVVSLTRRVAPRAAHGPAEVREVAGGALIVESSTTPTQSVRAHKRVHPLTPPAAPAPANPQVQLDAWIRRELRHDPHDRALRAHVIREASRVHRVSKRTAQRAVRRVAGGAR